MLYIKKKKNKEATEELIRVSKNNLLSIDNARDVFDTIKKSKIFKSIFDEQHGICAYCMRKISLENMNIEHYIPITVNYEKALDYNNMLGVCDGGENDLKIKNKHILYCDRSRNNKKTLSINPLKIEHIETIYYDKHTGKILSTIEKYNEDFDSLHLNGIKDSDGKIVPTNKLLQGRIDAYRLYEKLLKSTCDKSGQINKSKLDKLIQDEENRKEYREFEGVILYFLKRKFKRLTNRKKQ